MPSPTDIPTGRPAGEVVIAVDGFSFRIGRKSILRNVSFTVARAQRLAIVGPNGAGKTTLLKCIDGLLTGGTGKLEVFGRPLAGYRRKELARRISYVPQADGRVFPFTVEQFVLMGRYPYLNPFTPIGKEDRRAVREVMQLTATEEFADRLMDSLSGGERQKVYIAAALAQGANVLLLDEPTTFLDYRHQEEIYGLLERANREQGVTIVAVTHDLNQAVLQSERVLALRDGEVVFAGSPREVMQPETLRRVYGTSFLLLDHPTAHTPIIVPPGPWEATP